MKKPCYILGGMFLVSVQLTAAEIRVTNPNASSNWYVGTAYAITWTTSGDMPDRVTIRLRRAGSPASEPAVEVISPGTSLTGPCRWTIPDSVAPGRYFVRVKTIGGTAERPDVTGDSAAFTICPKIMMAPVTATLRLAFSNFKVVSPNGGERIEQSQRTAIRWSYSGSGDGIRLSIWVSGRSAFPEYPAMASGSTNEIARDIPG